MPFRNAKKSSLAPSSPFLFSTCILPFIHAIVPIVSRYQNLGSAVDTSGMIYWRSFYPKANALLDQSLLFAGCLTTEEDRNIIDPFFHLIHIIKSDTKLYLYVEFYIYIVVKQKLYKPFIIHYKINIIL